MVRKIPKTLRPPHWRDGRPSPKSLSIALLIVLLTAGQLSAGGYALSGVGSKAIGMGGAFRGLADDWSAAYWNPAGLTQLEQSEFTAMTVGISPRIQYTPQITYGGLDVGYRNGAVRYPNDKTVFVPDVAGFLKLEGLSGVTAGLAIFVPVGLDSEWDLYNPPLEMDIRKPFPWYDHKARLTVIDFHPTIAKAFAGDKLSLGVGVSIQRGSVEFRQTSLIPSGFPIPHENLLTDVQLKGDGWGYGANFGLLYKLSEKLQFGISGRTGTTLKMEGTSKQELYVFNDDGLRDVLIAEAQSSGASPSEIALIRALFGTDNLTSEPNAKADIKTPADFGFGIAYKPSTRLTFSGEIAYTQWSSLDSILIRLSGTDPIGRPAEDTPIMLKWDNTLRFSLGAEYWIMKPLALRFGYYLDPSPIPDETFSPLIPDVGDKNSFNWGAALNFRGMELSYNFEYIKFGDRNVTALEDVNNDGSFDNDPGLYQSSLYASHISFSYWF